MGAECFKSAFTSENDPTNHGRHRRSDSASASKSAELAANHSKPNANIFSYQRDKRRPHGVSDASKNAEDYVAEKLEPGSVWVRLPGQINDQRINIADCKQSTFVLADFSDSVQVDDCEKCVFFIGPSGGSVFLRGLNDCTVVVLCGQLRLRDCKNMRIGLMCKSKPVIETSRDVMFGPYAGPSYFDLAYQLSAAQMSSLNNRWSMVHDFTPAKNGGGPGKNFTFFSRQDSADLIPSLAEATRGLLMSADEEAAMGGGVGVVAVGLGSTCPADAALAVCGFGPGHFDAAEQLALRMSDAGVLVFSEERRFTAEAFEPIGRLFPDLKSDFTSGVCVVLSFISGSDNACDVGAKSEAQFVAFDAEGARLSKTLFEEQAGGDGFGQKHQ